MAYTNPAPCNLDAATIRDPQVGEDFVVVTSSAGPGARVRIFNAADFDELGDGSGRVGGRIYLSRAIERDEQIYVWQTLGSCSAADVYQTTAVCKASESFLDNPGSFDFGRRDYSLGTYDVHGVMSRVSGSIHFPIASGAPPSSSIVAWGGSRPVVVVAHGSNGIEGDPWRAPPLPGGGVDLSQHDSCAFQQGWTEVPSYRGFDYLGESLARHGYIVISVDFNDLTCPDLDQSGRALLVLEHLKRWKEVSRGERGDPIGGFRGRLDMLRVGLVGHSMGGHTVERVPQLNADSDIAIRGVVSIAPFEQYEEPANPELSGIPLLMILGDRDEDVQPLGGVKTYNLAEEGPGSDWFKSQLVIKGANHQRFNHEWPWDDGFTAPSLQHDEEVGLIPRVDIEKIVRSYATAFFNNRLAFQTELLPILAGDATISGVRSDVIEIAFRSAGALMVDDFDDADPDNELGGSYFTTMMASRVQMQGPEHAIDAYELVWAAQNAFLTTSLLPVPFDPTGFAYLAVRAGLPTGQAAIAFRLGLKDALDANAIETTAVLSTHPQQYLLPRSVRVPLACLLAGIDPEHVDRIRVIPAEGVDEGALLLDEVSFSVR